jgi:hypothetical protein
MLKLELRSLLVHNLRVNLRAVAMHQVAIENPVQSREQKEFQRVVN